MISVTFLIDYTLHGTNYKAGQIAFIEQKWIPFLNDKKIIRVTHKKDAAFINYQRGDHV